MELFSERMGKKLPKKIQFESMDDDLRYRLWNVLLQKFLSKVDYIERGFIPTFTVNGAVKTLIIDIWNDLLKRPLDDLPDAWDKSSSSWKKVCKSIKDYISNCKWYEVYDLLEFVARNYNFLEEDEVPTKGAVTFREYISACNKVLEEENSGYRFVGNQIVPITNEVEISEINQSLEHTKVDKLKPVHNHLEKALTLFSKKPIPDYENTINEAMKAVEAMCRLITKAENATLGDCLKKIEDKIKIHPALKKAFNKLYGYTSDGGGRHALLDKSTPKYEEAKFMLVSCSAFVNYLVGKSSKAGITFD